MENNRNDFWNVVQDAINTGNYTSLNEHVQESINDSVEAIRKEMKNSFEKVPGDIKKASWRPVEEKNEITLFAPQPKGYISGTIMAVCGYTFAGILYFAMMILFLILVLWPTKIFMVISGILAIIGTGFLGMGIAGTHVSGRARRFRKYVKVIGKRTYCEIQELSQNTGIPAKKIVKDLYSMIEKKMFLQGHVDKKETCLIVTDEMYQQYQQTEQQALRMEKEEKEKEAQRKSMPEECQKILEEGNWYIQYIRMCNDDIPGEEISQKLYHLEEIISRIFKEVEKHYELASDLRKFMNYYLPTTKKLLDVYREMDKETIAGEAIIKTRKEIEDTIDTINQAFENLLNSFFKEKALDVSSDISVLQTMLAQEGLTNSDFPSKNS